MGNEANSDEVPGKASRIVYLEGNQLVCEWRCCKTRGKPRSNLLSIPS